MVVPPRIIPWEMLGYPRYRGGAGTGGPAKAFGVPEDVEVVELRPEEMPAK